MSTIGYSTLDIIPSVRGLAREIDKQTRGLEAAGRKGGAKYGDAAGREAGQRFKLGFGSATKNLFAGALAGGAVVAGFKDIVGAASAAEQAVGGVGAVFKDYADTVLEDSKKAAEGLGLSATAYQELITLSGALLKNKGIEDFADQAKSLISIGADLAAQYGGSTRQAVEALNSALRGESDPIERYAISLNEAAVQSVLAANGQKDLTGAALDQAKAQARLTLISQQSADALGANAREADTFAGSTARLSANFDDMKVELGQKVLPVVSDFVGFLKDDGLPALEDAGGAVADAARAFNGLPGPVKAAAGAFVALRVAALAGVTASVASGFAAAGSALVSLRIRALLAADAYRATAAGAGTATAANGRLAASFAAVRAGATVSTPAVARFASAAKSVGAVAALAGVFAILEKTKPDAVALGRYVERVEALAGPKLADQIALLTLELEKQQSILEGRKGPGFFKEYADNLTLGLFDSDPIATRATEQSKALRDALAELRHQADLNKIATDRVTSSTDDYVSKLKDATQAAQKLLDKENERRNKQLGNRRDALALQQAIFDARREAFDGPRGLDITTEAGRDNQGALLDLAGQWNDSADAVQNADGAYRDIRIAFIKTAVQMGATKTEAKALATQLLEVPEKNAYSISTPGMKKALEDAKRLRELLAPLNVNGRIDQDRRFARKGDRGYATGGLIGGRGSGTSDSNLIWASRGEFMQRKAAVDYYGTDFMRRLNNLQIPKFAGGGQIGGGTTTVTHGPGVSIGQQTVVVPDAAAYMREMDRRRRLASLDGLER